MITDTKFLRIISSRLRNFKKQKDRLWNCSCPLCGDSQKDQTKARGYFFPHKGRITFKCHNCGTSKSFYAFLRDLDPTLFNEYRLERVRGEYADPAHSSRPPKHVESEADSDGDISQFVAKTDIAARLGIQDKPKQVDDNSMTARLLRKLTPFDEMRPDLQEYLLKRGIPLRHLRKYFFHTPKFKALSNYFAPGTFKDISVEKWEEERIVIAFFDKKDEIFAFQGRELTTSYAKYLTVKISEDASKIFGLDRIDNTEDVVVVEGPIDSLFFENSVGAAGADLVSQVKGIINNPIFFFDNEPRSRQICSKIEAAIQAGCRVVIPPANGNGWKDVNDLVKLGSDANKFVNARTFSGARAMLEYTNWKRCDTSKKFNRKFTRRN